jgi:hypothetical protein
MGHRSRTGNSDEHDSMEVGQKVYRHPRKSNQIMKETFDSSAKNLPSGNQRDDLYQNQDVASAMSSWKENLKDNLFEFVHSPFGLCSNELSGGLFDRPAAGG